ncbi:hypothetical protein KCU91_g144, partial [Aureobasidium melanogenum]
MSPCSILRGGVTLPLAAPLARLPNRPTNKYLVASISRAFVLAAAAARWGLRTFLCGLMQGLQNRRIRRASKRGAERIHCFYAFDKFSIPSFAFVIRIPMCFDLFP